MAQDMNIGAARVYLTVDTVDYEANIQRALNAAVGFGTDAERAFDKSAGGTRRASQRLLDYVADLGKTNTELTRFESLLRKASAGGADQSVLKAAARAWDDYATNVALTRIETESWERQTKRAAGAARELEQAQRSEAAAAREAANARARAYSQERATVERQFDEFGKSPFDIRRMNAQRQFGEAADPLIQQINLLEQLTREADKYAQELSQAKQEASGINTAFDKQYAELQQRRSAAEGLLGIANQPAPQSFEPNYLAEQRRVIAALEQQVLVEQQVEAQAREIHQEWTAINRQIEAVGKSTYDIMRMNAQQKYGANAAPLIEQINRWEKLNTTMSGSTVNAKQLQQAIRYLPAQFTDIATSLAGGMNPLLVLFQQGGQIFDQFRLSGAGVGDTLRTVGSYAAKLVNPLTLGLAAVGGMGFAAYKAEAQLSQFSKAMVSTGNYAGYTVDQLSLLVAELDKVNGVTYGGGMKAAGAVAATGLLSGEDFANATRAAAIWSSATGRAVEDVVQQFARLSQDPITAIKELNRTQRFLTEETYRQIESLVQQGRQAEAVSLAIKSFSDTLINRSPQMVDSLGNVEWAIRGLKNMALEAADAVIGIFRAPNAASRIRDLQNNIEAMQDTLNKPAWLRGGVYNMGDEQLRKSIARQQKMIAQITEDARKGQAGGVSAYNPEQADADKKRALDTARYLATANESAQRQITEAQLREDGKRLGLSKAQIDATIEQQRRAWVKQDSKRSTTGGTSARSAAREVRYDFEAQLAMLRTQARETEASYSLQEISATKYYETLRKLAIQERDIQLASNNAQIEAIQGKKGSEQELARLRAQNVQVEQQYLQRDIDLKTQQKQLAKQYNDEYRQLVYSLQDGTEAMRQQMEMEAISLGMSDKQFGRLQARIEIERDRERQLRELDRRVEENANFAEEAERRKAAIIEETNKKLAAQADLYGYIDAATGNWLTGAEKAWQEWLDQVGDVSGKAFNFFSSTFEGLADLTTDFLTGNEANWRDYLNNLARMITRFVVEQQLTKWMQSLKVGGDSGGGVMGFVGNLFGALLGSGGGNPNTVSYAPGGSFTWNPAVRPFAAGGVPGAAGLSAYRNQVVSSPTLFPFAAGGVPNWGLMGEAGREAIMPLTRTSNGDLGVRVASGGGGGPVTFNQTFVVQGTPDRMTRGQMMRAAGAETSRAIRRG